MDYHSLEQLDDTQQEKVVFKISIGYTLLNSEYPILRIWKSNQDDAEDEGTISLDEGADFLLIWKDSGEVKIDKLTDDQWELLNLIADGLSLGDIVLRGDIMQVFPEIIRKNCLIGYSV